MYLLYYIKKWNHINYINQISLRLFVNIHFKNITKIYAIIDMNSFIIKLLYIYNNVYIYIIIYSSIYILKILKSIKFSSIICY